MIKEKFILAAGSQDFSRKIVALFQDEGWQARSVTSMWAARRFLKEMQEVPQYFASDKINDWVILLARELHPKGTQIILSGAMQESQEELERILGTPYYSIMGLPSYVADVLLQTQIPDEYIDRLSHRAEIKMMDGSVFDKDLQARLGLDGLVVFHKIGFNPMNLFTREYVSNPSPNLVGRTAIWTFDRQPSDYLARTRLREMLAEVAEKGARTIGISQVELRDLNGEVIEDRRADEMLLKMVSSFMDNLGALLPIDKIYILIDDRCKSVLAKRIVPPRAGKHIPARTGACEQVFCRMLNKRFVERMGIDAIIDPIKKGFSESQDSWMGYVKDPAHGVKLVSFMYDRTPESALSVKEYKKMMDGLIDALVYQKAKVIATFPLYLTDENGNELSRSKDDETVMAYLTDWLQRHPDKDVRLLYIDGYTPGA